MLGDNAAVAYSDSIIATVHTLSSPSWLRSPVIGEAAQMKLSLYSLHASRGPKFHSCKSTLCYIGFAMQLNGFILFFYDIDTYFKFGVNDSLLL